MPEILTSVARKTPEGSDFWSWLLGIDRVRTDGGEVSIAWQHMPPGWVLCLVIIPAVLLLVALVYRRERKDVGGGPKILLTALRSALIVLLLLMLMGPVLTVETIKVRRAYAIVLVDDSRSMRKADPLLTAEEKIRIGKATGIVGDGPELGVSEDAALRNLTRAEVVKRVLENPKLGILDQVEAKLNVAYFTFSGTASAKQDRGALLEGYRPENCLGTETAIGDAIKAAMNGLRGQTVAAVVVISDGKNNAGMAPKEIAQQLKQRYVPIIAVASGVPHSPKDIGLVELEANEAVLANDTLEVKCKVRSFGYGGEKVTVELWAYPLKPEDKDLSTLPQDLERRIGESRRIAEQDVSLEGMNQKRPLSMGFSHNTSGDYLLILRVPPRVDENSGSNNYLTHRVRVVDDKIRVLYVEHPPRYEYRFLKNALIRDPKILCHTLLTSADEGFPQDHTRSDDPLFRGPLKEFPRDLKSLLEFDVVIYGDVEPGRLGPEAARHLETFVSEFGGGVLFISGMGNNPRALLETPLAHLLPVIPEGSHDLFANERIYSVEYGYLLTPDGKSSPILGYKEFRERPEANLEHWEDRDGRGDGQIPIRWYQPVRKVKAGGSVLVELTGVQGGSARPPLLVTQHVGRGRVFWSATDETWLWRKNVGDYPWFYPFWQQAMYWVRQGKLLGVRRYRVSVDKERYARGEQVQIQVNAYDERFDPRQDEALEIYVDPPQGDRIKLTVRRQDSTKPGYFEGKWTPSDTGDYRLWAGEEDESTRATVKFSVYIPDREEDEPILDTGTLQQLASESYGGKFFLIDQIGEIPAAVQKSELQLAEVKEDELWDSPLGYLLFALLITAEWILRKWWRML